MADIIPQLRSPGRYLYRSLPSSLAVRFILIAVLATSDVALADIGGPSEDLVVIEVDLPSKVVYGVEIIGLLPQGLVYRGESLQILGAASSASSISVDGANDGSGETAVTWSFDEIDNRNGEDFKISFQAVMADVPDNREDEVLSPIVASISWRDRGGAAYSGSDESDGFRVVEPDLFLERDTIADIVEEGEVATFDLYFGHSIISSSTAFDVCVEESLPGGLEYMPGSMEILLGPAGTVDASDPSRLIWRFDEVGRQWDRTGSAVVRYRARVRDEGDRGRLAGRALLTWSSASGENPEEREYFASSQSSFGQSSGSGLTVSLKDSPDPVSPGDLLNYTIDFESTGQGACDVVIKEVYDENVVFLSSSPLPDEGTTDRWSLGDLLQGESGSISLTVRVKPSAKPGTRLESMVEIRSSDGLNSSDICTTTVTGRTHLSIENKASSDLLFPGGSLNYTIFFRNGGDMDATNVTVTDIIDGKLEFRPDEDAVPRPSIVWKDAEGTHLLWLSEALGLDALRPGETGRIDISVRLPFRTEKPANDRIFNLFKIDSDQYAGEFKSLETFIVQSLYVRKKADKDVCRGGDIVNYTILYGNQLSSPAKDAEIVDRLPDVEFLSASPKPDYIKDSLLAWRIGTISPHKSGSINLSVKVRRLPEISYVESVDISGQGRMSARQRLSTAKKVSTLTNYVNITAYYQNGEARDSSYSNTRLSDALGVDLAATMHGSGCYEEERLINFSEKSISIDRHVNVSSNHADFGPALSSSWADRISAKNNLREESLAKSHLYTDGMQKDDFLLLDQNQTVFSSIGDYGGGIARFDYIKRSASGNDPFMEVAEDYRGGFKSEVHLDSYGRRVFYDRNAAGKGFVSADMRLSGERVKQRSYEHGSGSYRIDDLITSGSTIYKDVLVNSSIGYAANQSYGSFSAIYGSMWAEGMFTEDMEYGSSIGTYIRQGDYIFKEALMDSASLSMTSRFSGRLSIESAAGKERARKWKLDEAFIGRYCLDLMLGIGRMPEYFYPHLNMTKRVVRLDGDRVLFRINVTNDGNKNIAPLVVTDDLPFGLTYVDSSMRPKINGQSVVWQILSLPMGETVTIDLQAGWNAARPAVINEANALGYYSNRTITAEAACAFPGGYFSPKIESGMQALANASGFQSGQWRPPSWVDASANLSGCSLDEDCSSQKGSPFECSCDLDCDL